MVFTGQFSGSLVSLRGNFRKESTFLWFQLVVSHQLVSEKKVRTVVRAVVSHQLVLIVFDPSTYQLINLPLLLRSTRHRPPYSSRPPGRDVEPHGL